MNSSADQPRRTVSEHDDLVAKAIEELQPTVPFDPLNTVGRFYSRWEAAARLGISVRALGRMRRVGTGPRPLIFGSRVVYTEPALAEFVERRPIQEVSALTFATPFAAASLMGISEVQLATLRARRLGPECLLVGDQITYPLGTLVEFIERHALAKTDADLGHWHDRTIEGR